MPRDTAALIEQATRASSSQGLRYAHQRNLGCLAYARLHEGRIAEALQCAEEALGLARQQRQRVAEARVLHLLAEILAAAPGPGLDRIPEAVARCRDALALARELELDVLIGRCQETLTRLVQRQREGDQVDASRAIA